MKKLFTMLLACVTAVLAAFTMMACPAPEEKTLYVYTESGFAPYEYMDANGNVVGVDMDIMKYVGKELGYKVVIMDVAFGQIFTEVQQNVNAIGAAGITVNEERLENGIFSIPYATSVQYAIVPEGTFTDADLVDGKLPLTKLAGKKIGVQESTTGCWMVQDAISGTEDDDGAHVTGELEGSGATCIEYGNALLAALDFNAANALGAVVIDKLPAQSIVAKNSGLVCYQLDAEPESYALYMNKEATELKAEIDAVLTQMIADGKIEEYVNNHSGTSNN